MELSCACDGVSALTHALFKSHVARICWFLTSCLLLAEFCDALCKETWKVGGGKLEVIGGSVPATKEAVNFIQQDEMVDAFGEAPVQRPLATTIQPALLGCRHQSLCEAGVCRQYGTPY